MLHPGYCYAPRPPRPQVSVEFAKANSLTTAGRLQVGHSPTLAYTGLHWPTLAYTRLQSLTVADNRLRLPTAAYGGLQSQDSLQCVQ